MTDQEKLEALEATLKASDVTVKKILTRAIVYFILFTTIFAAGVVVGCLLF